MSEGVKIAAISYINSVPFVYGLRHSGEAPGADLLLDTPARCVEAYKSGECSIAIVPVGALDSIGPYRLVSDYCISSSYDVRTVVLLSHTPIEEIDTILLDSDSRTSVRLVRILARDYWQISPRFETIDARAYDLSAVPRGTGVMLIGDKVFEAEKLFEHSYDLVAMWRDMTSLPFVFAVWVARESVGREDEERLNRAIAFGVSHINEAVSEYVTQITHGEAVRYLTTNIEYTLTSDKRSAIELFLKKSESAEPSSGTFG